MNFKQYLEAIKIAEKPETVKAALKEIQDAAAGYGFDVRKAR